MLIRSSLILQKFNRNNTFYDTSQAIQGQSEGTQNQDHVGDDRQVSHIVRARLPAISDSRSIVDQSK